MLIFHDRDVMPVVFEVKDVVTAPRLLSKRVNNVIAKRLELGKPMSVVSVLSAVGDV